MNEKMTVANRIHLRVGYVSNVIKVIGSCLPSARSEVCSQILNEDSMASLYTVSVDTIGFAASDLW